MNFTLHWKTLAWVFGRIFSLQGQTTSLNLDLLVRPTHSHPNVDCNAAAHLKNNIRLAVMLEPLGRHFHRIGADINIREAIETVCSCSRSGLLRL